MNHLMLDLETLGGGPGCAIASIGAVVFTEEEVTQELEINVNVESCVDVGMRIDPATLIWWLQQSREAIDATFMQETMSIGIAVDEFVSFYEENMCERIWSHGATFDIPIMAEAARLCKRPPRINFRDARDTRTLYDLTGVNPRNFFDGSTKHRAIDDARAQAKAVIAAWDTIKTWKHPALKVIMPKMASNSRVIDGEPMPMRIGDPVVDELPAVVSKQAADLEVPAFLRRT